ncbi:FkbM family methyltransferase [Planctomyces sp. SH-PL62]|uniref:FkbM family methyltransferase n=1 Tax=Planctomyces sp. SH-PL62 TaxID=1636152 RepID=UPI00078B3910|nr:FkbM family methyltransferase [Planctomyces sp. SH-PL62]AMV36063.1 31-O-demethyl-FK506 methyltransferase FkbM [Planctomyces sp. SH-PL62]
MRIRLPNGRVIHGPSRGEARLLFDEIFREQVYLRNGVELHEGDVVLDVGANLGLFSLFVAETLHDVTIHAFEPVPDIFACLRRNTSHLGSRIVARNVGLSDREGTAAFTYYPHLPCFSTSCPDRLEKRWADLRDILIHLGDRSADGGGRGPFRGIRERLRSWGVGGLLYYASRKKERVCTLTRLSQIIAERRLDRIDLLKIDVEGSEWDVLRGIDEADWGKVKQLVVEVHDVESGPDGMAAWLEDRGYEVAIDRTNEDRRSPVSLIYARRRPEEAGSTNRSSRTIGRAGGPVAV